MDILTLTAAVVAILGFVYLVFIGQKNIFEYLRERRKKQNPTEEMNEITSPISESPPSIPQNLPHRGDFVGREKEKKQVHEALTSRSFIVMIDGIGGIGKTSLALEVLHECLTASQNSERSENGAQKFEAFIWTSAKDHPLALNDVLDTIARTLEYPYITQLSPEEKQHEVMRRLREKSCLLIVDNFETVTDDALHDFIRNLPEPSKCLITSRVQSLRQARAVSIRGLDHAEARQLIANEGSRLGLDLAPLADDAQNFQRFYEATGGAPLAIRWSIGQIKQRGQSIDGVLDSLYDARGDIFEFIFERAWSLLSEPAIQILTIMPVFAASASKAAIEAASDMHKFDLDEGLGQLVELWLLEASDKLDAAKRRYSLHPLTRAYAQKRLTEQGDLERQARVRLADYFEQFAKERGGDQWAWERYDEIEEEKDNIFALIEWCFANDEGLSGMRLTKAVTFFMSTRGLYYDGKIFGDLAVEFAQKEEKIIDLAWLLVHGIGWIEIHSGNLTKAEDLIREGLKLYESLKNLEGVRNALHNLGLTLRYKGDFNAARLHYEKGIVISKSISDDDLAIAIFKRGLAILDASEGKLSEAKKELESTLPILRAKDALSLAGTMANLADVNNKLKDYETAFELGLEGLKLAKKMKKRFTVAWISRILVKTEIERGNTQSALLFAKQALEYYERSGFFNKKAEEVNLLIKELQEKLAEQTE